MDLLQKHDRRLLARRIYDGRPSDLRPRYSSTTSCQPSMSRPQASIMAAILVLAAILRFTGLTWGVPSPEYPHHPFHPDEAWAMRVLCGANPAQGDFVIEGAHREGSLLAQLFLAQALVLKQVGLISDLPCSYSIHRDSPEILQQDYRRVFIASRALVAVLDLVAVVLVFLILRRIADPWSGLLAAGIFAIIPFEVVHAHYMRTHTPANLTILLALYASLGLVEDQSRKRIVIVGALCGVATAMRYTSVVVILVPALVIATRLLRQPQASGSRWRRVGEAGAMLFCGTVLGLFLGDPPLFLAFNEVRQHIAIQMSFAAPEQFSAEKILDLRRVELYLSRLIPHATGSWLWTVFITSMAYCLFLRRFYIFTLPWLALGAVYLFFMAKGYAAPVYARAAINLFPIFVLTLGVAVHDVFSRTGRFPVVRWGLALWLVLAAGWTLLFDAAYLRAMTGERDTRYQVRRHLLEREAPEPLVVGLYADNKVAYFTTKPAFELSAANPPRFDVQTEFLGISPEIHLLALSGYNRNHRRTDDRLAALIESGAYTLELSVSPELSFLGWSFDYRAMPSDMQYPFVELVLLRPTRSPAGGS